MPSRNYCTMGLRSWFIRGFTLTALALPPGWALAQYDVSSAREIHVWENEEVRFGQLPGDGVWDWRWDPDSARQYRSGESPAHVYTTKWTDGEITKRHVLIYQYKDAQGRTGAGGNIVVNVRKLPPTAVEDQFETLASEQLAIPRSKLLANDADEVTRPLLRLAAIDTKNTLGQVQVTASGFQYDPTSFAFRMLKRDTFTDSFRYRIKDHENRGAWATVKINVSGASENNLEAVQWTTDFDVRDLVLQRIDQFEKDMANTFGPKKLATPLFLLDEAPLALRNKLAPLERVTLGNVVGRSIAMQRRSVTTNEEMNPNFVSFVRFPMPGGYDITTEPKMAKTGPGSWEGNVTYKLEWKVFRCWPLKTWDENHVDEEYGVQLTATLTLGVWGDYFNPRYKTQFDETRTYPIGELWTAKLVASTGVPLK